MSYILDALRRANADREPDHVPGLHSQGENHPATKPDASWRRHTAGGAATLVLLTAAALTWWSLRTPDAPTPPEVRTAAVSVDPAPADAALPATPSLPMLAPEPPVKAQSPAPDQPPTKPSRPRPVATTADAAEEGAEAGAADMIDTATETEDPVVPAAPAPQPPPRQTTLPPQPAAPLPMATADASGRPPVRVSGSSYSKNPAHRILIANGKVVHEGQEIEPGLRLESVGPRSAVLNHSGTLYNIAY